MSMQIAGNFIGKDDKFLFLYLSPFPCIFHLKWDVCFIQPGSVIWFGGWDCCGLECFVDCSFPPLCPSELGLSCVRLFGKLNLLDGLEAVVAGLCSRNVFSGVKCRLGVLVKKKGEKPKLVYCAFLFHPLSCVTRSISSKGITIYRNYLPPPCLMLEQQRLFKITCFSEKGDLSQGNPLQTKVIIPANLQ